MKYVSLLNNYQIGSYAHNVLKNNIISENRINSKHTEVVWELNQSEYSLLSKVIGKYRLHKLGE